MVKRHKEAARMLERTQKDYLTGFYTRESLDKFLEDIIMDCKVGQQHFSLAVVDIDKFKWYNDKYGHAFGDDVLKYAASTLRLTLFEVNCYLFRYGGDEFVVVIPNKKPAEAYRILNRCHYTVRRRAFLLDSKLYKVTMSGGIAGFPDDAQTAESLLEKADKAMYFSKRRGRNLTTMASRIWYLRLRDAFLALCSISVILCAFVILSRLYFPIGGPPPAVKAQEPAKITAKPERSDIILLKRGSTYKGRILREDKNGVMISTWLETGEGVLTIPRSSIEEIKYGAVTDAKEAVAQKRD
jgi:diguanylate cyclase (GGDEF)-like protein